MDSGGSTVMQSNSEPFKQEDPLMSRLKEILLQQEMIEKRLKESRILANQPNSSTTKMATISSNANSAVVVQVNGHEVHDCNDIDNIGTKDTCNDHQESKSSEPEEKKKKEVDGKVEKVANEEAGEKKEFRSKESNEEEEEVKAGSKCSNDAIGIDKSVGNDSALDLNVSQNSHEIDTNRPLVGKSNRSGDDQVDRAVTDKSIESEMHPHDGADDADDDHHPIDDSSSLGGGRDDSAFGDSVESFGGDLDTSSERTESSPEPFVMHDENNNPLFDSPPEIELIIRASNIDGRRKGACLFCQEYFMDLYLLAELEYIKLNVSTVNLKKPPKDFRAKFDCTPPPILLDKKDNQQRAILENERIERYILKNVPGGHRLFFRDQETASLIQNLYSKFKLALTRDESHTRNNLLNQLESIDDHLRRRDSRFLTGPHVCCFDCELIARLQHIRVAGPYFLDGFQIPAHFDRLWRYMGHMYELQAFVESCPADQDIISHYLTDSSLRQRTAVAKKIANLQLQTPTYSITLPSEVQH